MERYTQYPRRFCGCHLHFQEEEVEGGEEDGEEDGCRNKAFSPRKCAMPCDAMPSSGFVLNVGTGCMTTGKGILLSQTPLREGPDLWCFWCCGVVVFPASPDVIVPLRNQLLRAVYADKTC
jgi:hypothetical protein